MNKFYSEIDKALQSYENYKPYHTHATSNGFPIEFLGVGNGEKLQKNRCKNSVTEQ